ncbi:MAG: glutaminase [Alphaproteobacteria bacterium]|nr:glutaminase [Alphaproteobacteria bacterium]
MNLSSVLEEIESDARQYIGRGMVADYIPALARVPADKFGMAVHTAKGQTFNVGDSAEAFSIQSISKVFSLMLAMRIADDERLWNRVGREPSGNAFNSLVQLEHEKGIPRNPFINAGAIVVIDALISVLDEAKDCFLDYARRLSGDSSIGFDEDVARSEYEHGYINFALANFMKAHDNIENSLDLVLDAYFHHCSLAMSCEQLARAFLPLANDGFSPVIADSVLTDRQSRQINSLMLTCGLYDAVGRFAYRVGLPAKSGVGGGIVAIVPNEMTIAVWAPELDENGNSVVGTRALELFAQITGRSIF